MNSDGSDRGAADEESELNTSRPILASLVLILVVAGFLAGWLLNSQRPERFMEVDSPDRTAPSEQTSPRPKEPAASIPSEDVPGAEISNLPRYPGSVRVEYERTQQDGLKIIRVKYLTRDGLDAVRGFYRGVFRAEGWKVANVEFTEDRWTFLVLHGAREASIRIEPYGRGATSVAREFSEPLPEKEPTPEETPQRRRPARPEPASLRPATPTPTPAPQTASPAPQTAPPAPAPGYDGGYRDDFGDDGGGLGLLGRFEAVASTPHRGDQGALPPTVELVSEVAYIDINHVGARIKGVVPHCREDLLAAEYLSLVAHKVLKEGELPA